MSSLAAVLGSLAGQSPSDKLEYDHGSLQIRANTLVIGDAMYPIANISTVSVADLRNPVPTSVWALLAAGVIFMLTGLGAVLGIALIGLALYLIFLNYKSRAAADYALNVQMNSGNTAVVMNDDVNFLKDIALELYEVIEFEIPSHATFNIDRSVKIDNVTNSAVSVGRVSGDLVSNVQGI